MKKHRAFYSASVFFNYFIINLFYNKFPDYTAYNSCGTDWK